MIMKFSSLLMNHLKTKMNIFITEITTTWLDYPDDESVAIEVFFSGCDFRCKNCQNPEQQITDVSYRIELEDAVKKITEEANKNRTDKVVFVGGDSLSQKNREGSKKLLAVLSNLGFKVILYTGYSIEKVKEFGITGAEFYKCGVFKEEEKNSFIGKTDTYISFASKNQILYDKNYNQVSKDGVYYFSK